MESIETKQIRSLCYRPDFLRSKLTCPTIPIPGLVPIPNIVMVDSNKKKSVVFGVRNSFNKVTKTNVDEIKKELRINVTEILVNVKNPEINLAKEMNEIANEILHNFIVSEFNIKIYIQMLNEIHNIALNYIDTKGTSVSSKSISYYFIDNCRKLILKYISIEHIRTLALKDQEDEDELDLFNKEKSKICNLIITICSLYDQRDTFDQKNSPSIQLGAIPLYKIINTILNTYSNLTSRMKKLGNPNDENTECSDEFEYECLDRMRMMYAEQVIIFFDLEYGSFIKDNTIVQETIVIGDKSIVQDKLLSNLITRFESEVYPNVNEPHLKLKCEKFGFK